MLVHQHDEYQGAIQGLNPDPRLWTLIIFFGRVLVLARQENYTIPDWISGFACMHAGSGSQDSRASTTKLRAGSCLGSLSCRLLEGAESHNRRPKQQPAASKPLRPGAFPACYRCRARCCRGRLRPEYEMLDEACPCRVWTRPSSLQPSLKDGCALQELRRRRPIPCRSVGL